MQSAITRGLMLALIMLGLLAAAPMMYAGVITNHSGAICNNYSAEDATFIGHYANGSGSAKTSGPTSVTCPLTRNTSNSKGAVVYVDVSHHYGTQTTVCGAFSLDLSGQFIAGVSETWTGSGFHEFVINLTGDNKSNLWSDYSVVCSIPGKGSGVIIHGIDLNEAP